MWNTLNVLQKFTPLSLVMLYECITLLLFKTGVLSTTPGLFIILLVADRLIYAVSSWVDVGCWLYCRFLNNNGLRSLERGAFDELTSLQWLKLNKNRLRVISPALLSRLHSLKYLWVIYSQVYTIITHVAAAAAAAVVVVVVVGGRLLTRRSYRLCRDVSNAFFGSSVRTLSGRLTLPKMCKKRRVMHNIRPWPTVVIIIIIIIITKDIYIATVASNEWMNEWIRRFI